MYRKRVIHIYENTGDHSKTSASRRVDRELVPSVLHIRLNRRLTRFVGGAIGITRTLGLITYPLYLVHNIVGVAFLNGLVVIGIGRFAALGFAVLGMTALAWIISRTGEPWLAGILKRLFSFVEHSIATAPGANRLLKPTTPVSG